MKYYVTMTDKFLSGWGLAEGRINKLVFECDTLRDAEIVKQNAQHRTEMKYISVATKKPSYPSDKYIVNYKTKKEYPHWFDRNYFD